jgi:cytochrome c-type biogenesis protein CcmF
MFILAFLIFCIGGALSLYAWRAQRFQSNAGFSVVSRESFLLLNNVFLVAAAGLILVGTLYPLFLDALHLGKISVGPPYFATVFMIPMLPLVFLLAVGMHAAWKRANLASVKTKLLATLAAAVTLAIVIPLVCYGAFSVLSVIGFAAGMWVVLSALIEPVSRLRAGHTLSAGVLGMSVAHLGLGLFVLGATIVKTYEIEKDLSMKPGQTVAVGNYEFRLTDTRKVEGPNYDAVEATVVVSRLGNEITTLHPQKRTYRVQTNTLTEAGIDPGWNRDLFVAMGEPLGQGAWSFRLQYKPLVRFIWIGAVIMALGGLIGVTDRRYRVRAARTAADTGEATVSV